MAFEITKHTLVPKHSKATDKEKKELLEKYTAILEQLPKILSNDPAIQNLDVKVGDIIRVERNSMTAGNTLFYRRVINA